MTTLSLSPDELHSLNIARFTIGKYEYDEPFHHSLEEWNSLIDTACGDDRELHDAIIFAITHLLKRSSGESHCCLINVPLSAVGYLSHAIDSYGSPRSLSLGKSISTLSISIGGMHLSPEDVLDCFFHSGYRFSKGFHFLPSDIANIIKADETVSKIPLGDDITVNTYLSWTLPKGIELMVESLRRGVKPESFIDDMRKFGIFLPSMMAMSSTYEDWAKMRLLPSDNLSGMDAGATASIIACSDSPNEYSTEFAIASDTSERYMRLMGATISPSLSDEACIRYDALLKEVILKDAYIPQKAWKTTDIIQIFIGRWMQMMMGESSNNGLALGLRLLRLYPSFDLWSFYSMYKNDESERKAVKKQLDCLVEMCEQGLCFMLRDFPDEFIIEEAARRTDWQDLVEDF